MKLYVKFILIGILVLGIGFLCNNTAFSKTNNSPNIAVVDVQEVLRNYDKLNTFKQNQKAKLLDLQKFVDDARKKVADEKDATKKKNLEDKYNQELRNRKKILDDEYQAQVADIDKSINTVINNIAKSNNYDLVFRKDNLLYGGKDITGDIIKALK